MTDKLNEFEFLQKLGDGAYSHVYKVRRKGDGAIYALKKVKMSNLSDKEKQNAINEVRLIASIRSLSVVSYKEAFVTDNSLCIVMEYTDNGDLFEKICYHQKKNTLFKEEEVWQIFIQVTSGLKALHDLAIFHRDIKSANIFLNRDGSCKLGDMNVSKVAKKGMLYTQTGTPYYASPEVWRDQPYDSKSDIWSFGCVLYEMCALKPPFRAEDMQGLYRKVLRGQYPKIPSVYSSEMSNMIKALLQVSPHMRPDAEKILSFPVVIKKMTEKYIPLEYDANETSELLNTIKIPKNLGLLTDHLPKPTYNDFKDIKGLGKRVRSHENSLVESDLSVLPSINNTKLTQREHNDSTRKGKSNESGEYQADEEEAGARRSHKDAPRDHSHRERDPSQGAAVQKKEIQLNISPEKEIRDRKEYRKVKEKRRRDEGSVGADPARRKPTEETDNDGLKLPRIYNKHSSSMLPDLNIKSASVQRDNSSGALNKYANHQGYNGGSYNQGSNSNLNAPNPGGVYKMLVKDKYKYQPKDNNKGRIYNVYMNQNNPNISNNYQVKARK